MIATDRTKGALHKKLQINLVNGCRFLFFKKKSNSRLRVEAGTSFFFITLYITERPGFFFKGVKSSVDLKKKPSFNDLNQKLISSTLIIFFPFVRCA